MQKDHNLYNKSVMEGNVIILRQIVCTVSRVSVDGKFTKIMSDKCNDDQVIACYSL